MTTKVLSTLANNWSVGGTCKSIRRSVSGHVVYMKDTLIFVKSGMQKNVALWITKSELNSGVTCTQDMLYAMRVLVVLGLKVELSMVLEIDNKGTVNSSK